MVVLGAPQGPKTARELSLPDSLEQVPDPRRRGFARTYLQFRGTRHLRKDTITFRELRSPQYLDELSEFLENTAGEPVRRNGKNAVVSAAAARALELY